MNNFVIFVPQLGPWSSLTAYQPGDGVSLNGNSYVAAAANTNSQPPSADWYLVAAQGAAQGVTAENKIINGDFRVQQRGSTAKTVAAGTYYLDRWLHSSNVAPAIDCSPQSFTPGQTDVPGNPKFFARLDCAIGPSGQTVNTFSQRIEGVETFAGQTCTLSFYAKASSAVSLGVIVRQSFGAGGSSNVDSTAQNQTLTTSWAKYTYTVTLASISGKTIGASDFLEAMFSLPLNASFQIDIADVQLEAGPVASDFERRLIAQELDLCLRYFERIKATDNNSLFGIAYMSSGTVALATIPYVRKRAVPAVTFSAASDFRFNGIGANPAGASVTYFASNDGPTIIGMFLTLASSQTQGIAGAVSANNTTNATIDIDAEL